MSHNERECGDCNACCTGTLSGEVRGIPFFPGKPCHFTTGSSCSIYEDRPGMCRQFRCAWLDNEELPEWMKPSKSNGIITVVTRDGITWAELHEISGTVVSAVTLSNFMYWGLINYGNVRWNIANGWNYYGSAEFVEVQQAQELGNAQ